MQGASISLIVISSCQIGPSQRNFASQPPPPPPSCIFGVVVCCRPGRRYCWFGMKKAATFFAQTRAIAGFGVAFRIIRSPAHWVTPAGILGCVGTRDRTIKRQAKPGLDFGCWPAVGGRKRRCFTNFFYVRWWLVGGWWHGEDEGQNPAPPGGPRRVWWLPWHVGELRCAWGGRWCVFWSLLVGWSARPAREAGGAAPRAH